MLRAPLFAAIALSCSSLCAQPQTLYTFNGDSADDWFGMSVSGTGDVDGDGVTDFIVGAPRDDNNGTDSGSARVFSGRTGTVLHTFHGDSAQDNFGRSVGGAGDVDGDGFADLIVGAPADDNNGAFSGSARVFSGRTGAILYTFNGDSASDQLGFAVDGAGDVNGDGFDDLIAGAIYDDNNGTESGSARVFSGKDGSVLYTVNGDSTFDRLGHSVSSAGDVNRDGFADFIAGAPYDDNNGPDCGSARVYSGLNGATLRTFHGDSSQDLFGVSVSGAGDVNNDRYDDLIIGAWKDDNGGTDSGSARVFSGQNGATLYTFHGDSPSDSFGYAVSGVGDADGDGFGDFVVGAFGDDNFAANTGSVRFFSGKTGAILHTFNGSAASNILGSSVSGVGDIDGDGFTEFAAGAHWSSPNGSRSGRAKIFDVGLSGTPPRMRIFGTACPGSNGSLPHIGYRGRLAVGESIDFLLRGSKFAATCALVLAPPTNVDLGLTFPGLAGCHQYAEADYIIVWTQAGRYGTAAIKDVQLPNNSSLIGWRLNAQWACQDISANPFGAITSNALEMVFGT